MAFAQGMREALHLSWESSYKVLPATPLSDLLPIINPNMQVSRNKFKSEALTGSPEPRPIVFGKKGIAGDVEVEGNLRSLMTVCKGVFGAPVTTGAGPYTHTYNLTDMLSCSIQQSHTDISRYLLRKGCYLGSFGATFGSEGLHTVRVGVRGSRETVHTATQMTGAVTDKTTDAPLSYLLARLTAGGSTLAYAQSISVNVDRGLGDAVAMDETDELATIFSQIASVTGDVTLLFQDTAQYELALAGTSQSLVVLVPGATGGHKLEITMPLTRFNPMSVNTAGTGLVTVTGTYEAEASGATKSITVVIVNATAA